MRMKCLGVPKGVQETWSQVLPVSSWSVYLHVLRNSTNCRNREGSARWMSAACPVRCCELRTPPTLRFTASQRNPDVTMMGPVISLAGSNTIKQPNVRFATTCIVGKFSGCLSRWRNSVNLK